MHNAAYFIKLDIRTALANEDTLLPTQMFPRLPARATKNVSDFVQKYFVSATNVFPVCAAWKHNIMSNNVSATCVLVYQGIKHEPILLKYFK